MSKNLVIYHNGTLDGKACAYSAWKSLGEVDTEYKSMDYSSTPAKRIENRYDYIYVLGLTLSQQAANELKLFCDNLVCITQSGTYGEADICITTSQRSCCSSVWEYFHGDTNKPLVFKHIKDFEHRDNLLGNSYNICLALSSFTMLDFRAHMEDDTITEESTKAMLLASTGCAYAKLVKAWIDKVNRRATPYRMFGHSCLISNAPKFMSFFSLPDLAKNNPDIKLVASYEDFSGVRFWSLYTNDPTLDVSELASRHGGGGDPQSAGFSTEIFTNLFVAEQ